MNKETTDRYRKSPKGIATLYRYHQTDKFKTSQKKYWNSEKGKANRAAKPEIYKIKKDVLFTRNTCNILQEHAEKVGDDPERLTTEFICKLSGILLEEPL